MSKNNADKREILADILSTKRTVNIKLSPSMWKKVDEIIKRFEKDGATEDMAYGVLVLAGINDYQKICKK